MELLNNIFNEYSNELVSDISQNYNISKKEAYDEIYGLFTRNLESHKPL